MLPVAAEARLSLLLTLMASDRWRLANLRRRRQLRGVTKRYKFLDGILLLDCKERDVIREWISSPHIELNAVRLPAHRTVSMHARRLRGDWLIIILKSSAIHHAMTIFTSIFSVLTWIIIRCEEWEINWKLEFGKFFFPIVKLWFSEQQI